MWTLAAVGNSYMSPSSHFQFFSPKEVKRRNDGAASRPLNAKHLFQSLSAGFFFLYKLPFYGYYKEIKMWENFHDCYFRPEVKQTNNLIIGILLTWHKGSILDRNETHIRREKSEMLLHSSHCIKSHVIMKYMLLFSASFPLRVVIATRVAFGFRERRVKKKKQKKTS